MTRTTLFVALTCSTLALADAKEDAQKKVDEAMAQSCELAKKNVTDRRDVCADEFAMLGSVDCQSRDQRKASDFLKVNGECTRKLKEKAAPASRKDEKKGSHCKVVDESGAVVAELDSDGTSVKCNMELRDKVKAEKCEPGKKLEYQFIGEALGKETRPSAFSVTCPGK
jgi:hypothetical protein